MESLASKNIQLDSNNRSLKEHSEKMFDNSQNSGRFTTKINGLVVRRTSREPTHNSYRLSQEVNESYNSNRVSYGYQNNSLPVDVELSHITEENIQRSNTKSGVPNNSKDPHGFDSNIYKSGDDKNVIQKVSNLKLPNSIDQNESFQVVDSVYSKPAKLNDTSNNLDFNECPKYLLYVGPIHMIYNNQMKFCEGKALDVLDLNQISNVKNSGGLLNLSLNKPQKTAQNYDSKINYKARVVNSDKGNSSVLLTINGQKPANQVKRISINHGSVNNSFRLSTQEELKRLSLLKRNSRGSSIPMNQSRNSSNSRHVITFRRRTPSTSITNIKPINNISQRQISTSRMSISNQSPNITTIQKKTYMSPSSNTKAYYSNSTQATNNIVRYRPNNTIKKHVVSNKKIIVNSELKSKPNINNHINRKVIKNYSTEKGRIK